MYTRMQVSREKLIYLDFNIILNTFKSDSSKEKILKLKEQYTFPYSSAHIEEINNITFENFKERERKVKEHLHLIKEISDSVVLRPSEEEGILILREDPIFCYRRVKADDTYNSLIDGFLKEVHNPDLYKRHRESLGIRTEVINNIEPSKIFKSKELRAITEFMLEGYNINPSYRWEFLSKDFKRLEAVISILFNILNTFGYAAEKNTENTYRSKIHDVTHAIYGSQTKFLVTEDKRFSKKCTAVYDFLEIPTKVVKFQEFSELS